MRIKATQTFLHGTKRYEKNKRYSVDDILAGYFIGQGWAQGSDGVVSVPNDAVTTLDVQDANISGEAENVG